MLFKIAKSSLFEKHYKNFPLRDKQLIAQFVKHIIEHGFEGLEGRNKSSDNVPKNDPHWSRKVAFAQKHHLWHYHIGIIKYDESKPFGDRTSEYILHYQLLGDTVKLIDYTYHPPFELPQIAYFA